MSINISASTVQQGKNTFYTFHVIDKSSGQITNSISTSNPKLAKEFLEQQKMQQGPGATLNGAPLSSADPFIDGTFIDQGDDVKVGGFKSAPTYDKMGNPISSDPEAPLTAQQALANNPDARALGTPKTGKNPIPSTRLRRLAREYCGLPEEDKKEINSLTKKEKELVGGTFGSQRKQARVNRLTLPSETIVARGPDNNAFIIIGNDRAGSPLSGNGGKGHTHCDAIDLCAGLGGFCPTEIESATIEDIDGKEVTIDAAVQTNPNFFVDAARIYIAQKTDVDKNFGIGEFGLSQASTPGSQEDTNIGKYGGKSAVAAKADNIRLIGRESIRLVTGTDEFNSAGGRISGKHGIELVAMNKTNNLQPLVLGDNLALALTVLAENIEAIAEIFQAYVHYQQKFNNALQMHTHVTPFFGIPTLPSGPAIISGIQCGIETITNTELSIMKHITNIKGLIANFLVDSGESYINSRQNKSN